MGVWGFVWAMFAAAAWFGLAVAAATLLRRGANNDEGEFNAGYNALATVVDRR